MQREVHQTLDIIYQSIEQLRKELQEHIAR